MACVLCLGSSLVAHADNWQARIYDTALPSRVVAVDKGNQIFHLFEKQSPLSIKYSFPCTTGQAVGDKQIMNDLRTPEGVYFVEYKIANGLDFKEYGGIAYTLNYPNPVDKLRGKTGHGIWIHSKGFGIVPRDTRGCVAIGLDEIAEVGPLLTPGTAVLLAEQVPTDAQPRRDPGIAKALTQKMEQWTRAWATRSPRMFDMYDEEAYGKAMPESFAAFKANKQRLFRMLPWINIFNREVHALEGPGYWVTWSEQFYRAPNLSTEGIRRLYWQQNKDGKFRIVGMEWTPRNLGMHADYLKGRLVASTDNSQTDAASEAPMPPPLSMPESADSPSASLAPPLQNAPGTATAAAPTAVAASPLPMVPVEPVVDPAPRAPMPPVFPVPSVIVAAAKPTVPPVNSALVQPPLELDKATVALLTNKMEQWSQAWQARSPQLFAFYDSAAYGKKPLPSTGNAPQRADSFRALKADMERRFRSPWLHIVSRPVSVSLSETDPHTAITRSAHFIRVPGQNPVQGTRSLYWQKGKDGQFRIVNSSWNDAALGMETDYLEFVTAQIGNFIEDWSNVWLEGNVESYGQFYHARAKQQGRQGKDAILAQKRRVWSKAAPVVVQLSGLRVLLDPKGIRADMSQVYRDSSNYEDRGTKTLLLEPVGTSWKIIEEDWAAMPVTRQ